MSILKSAGFAAAVIVVGLVIITVVMLLGAAIGGALGYSTALGYNHLFGVGFDPMRAAVVGSIVGLAGGSSASAAVSSD